MKFKTMMSLWIFGLVLFGVEAFAGSFEGVVQTDANIPVDQVVVILTDDQGNTQQTNTLMDGSYSFENLPEGWYTVHIVVPIGYVLFAPPCGFHYKYVKTKGKTRGNFGLKAASTGVVIEFGKPGGRSAGGNKSLSQQNGYFSISVYLSNMLRLTPPYPQTISIRGTWILPGYGPVYVTGISGIGVGKYLGSNLDVSFNQLGGHLMEINLTRANWPHFSLDGEAVLLELLIPSHMSLIQDLGGQIVFCFESVTLVDGSVLNFVSFSPYIAYFQ